MTMEKVFLLASTLSDISSPGLAGELSSFFKGRHLYLVSFLRRPKRYFCISCYFMRYGLTGIFAMSERLILYFDKNLGFPLILD